MKVVNYVNKNVALKSETTEIPHTAVECPWKELVKGIYTVGISIGAGGYMVSNEADHETKLHTEEMYRGREEDILIGGNACEEVFIELNYGTRLSVTTPIKIRKVKLPLVG